MAHLIYYSDERQEFQEEFKKVLPNQDAGEIVIRKLLRHFKLGKPFIYWTSGRNHSNAGAWSITINVEQNNFGVICHEVAHTFQAQKDKHEAGEKWHTKRHRRIMIRMLNYCRKKNWFADELTKRTAPKPEKPMPSASELRTIRITALEIKRTIFERKIRLAENRIKKLNRQISALKRFV